MITTLLFDIHEVVFLRNDARFEQIARKFGVTPEVLTKALHREWNLYKTGGLAEDRYWRRVVTELGASFHGSWDALRDEMDLVDDVNVPLVDWIRAHRQDFRMAALSNAGADLERRLAHFGLDPLFDLVINSHRVSMAKPDEAIYQHALQVLGVGAEAVLFVDDRDRNTVVAERLGFQTHVYTGFDGFLARMNIIM